MKRRSVALTDPQLDWLSQEAERLGLTIGELVRRIIDDARKASEGVAP